jgi:hypothetical protein
MPHAIIRGKNGRRVEVDFGDARFEVAPKRANVVDKQISRHRLFPIHAGQRMPRLVRHALHGMRRV